LGSADDCSNSLHHVISTVDASVFFQHLCFLKVWLACKNNF
jgi:hypothetical protein